MTTATIAAIPEQMISRAYQLSLPQYRVFLLFSLESSIVSFNWDGLAIARCPQRIVLHPHGIVQPRLLSNRASDTLLFDTQDIDEPLARHWFLPNLVLPGEETSPALAHGRKEVLDLWMNASSIVIVGYSFGLASKVSYDEVWLDFFAEACSRKHQASIHIISPDALILREALCDRVQRSVNVFAWPIRWNVMTGVLLEMASSEPALLSTLGVNGDRMKAAVREIDRRTERSQ